MNFILNRDRILFSVIGALIAICIYLSIGGINAEDNDSFTYSEIEFLLHRIDSKITHAKIEVMHYDLLYNLSNDMSKKKDFLDKLENAMKDLLDLTGSELLLVNNHEPTRRMYRLIKSVNKEITDSDKLDK